MEDIQARKMRKTYISALLSTNVLVLLFMMFAIPHMKPTMTLRWRVLSPGRGVKPARTWFIAISFWAGCFDAVCHFPSMPGTRLYHNIYFSRFGLGVCFYAWAGPLLGERVYVISANFPNRLFGNLVYTLLHWRRRPDMSCCFTM